MHDAVTLSARILRVSCGDLLVIDRETHQEVIVHTPDAVRYHAGEDVCVTYNGAMTMSIPPQISAARIRRGLCRRPCGCRD